MDNCRSNDWREAIADLADLLYGRDTFSCISGDLFLNVCRDMFLSRATSLQVHPLCSGVHPSTPLFLTTLFKTSLKDNLLSVECSHRALLCWIATAGQWYIFSVKNTIYKHTVLHGASYIHPITEQANQCVLSLSLSRSLSTLSLFSLSLTLSLTLPVFLCFSLSLSLSLSLPPSLRLTPHKELEKKL